MITERLLEAIADDPRSYYRLAKDSGVNLRTLLRFSSGELGLSLANIEKLCGALDLRLVPETLDS